MRIEDAERLEVMTELSRDDYDSPWKEALERRFPEFLALLFPAIHAEVDWRRGQVFLDKELQQVVRDAQLGRRYADKLVKVWARDGNETWVLIHVEVQGEAERTFAERMYIYHYRLFDRYRVDVVSLGVLADSTEGFRPRGYRWERWGCGLEFRFPVVKLLDWRSRCEELEASDNVFALVVMAHLRAKTRRNAQERSLWKFRLVKLLYERGYPREVVLELFRVIDWMMRLPDELERRFLEAVYELEEAKKMPYVTSAERFGIEKGLQQGLQQGLAAERQLLLRQIRRRFGAGCAEAVAGMLERIEDTERLAEIGEWVVEAEDGEAFLARLREDGRFS